MKFNLKLLAAAAAMVAVSSAHANLIAAGGGNSSFALVAFNPSTNAYYVRDLGYTLNSFLPSSVTTTAIDGGGSAVTGDKTSEAGAHITWGDTNGTFASWVTGQSSVLWTVAAGDASTAAGTSNLTRAVVAFGTAPAAAIQNQTVRTAVGSSNGVSGLATQNNPLVYDATGSTVVPGFLSNNAFGAATLTALGSTASLYYYATTAGTGASTTAANFTVFGNSLNTATLQLASNGVLTYDLAPAAVSAVPLPAAAWLMVSGLAGVGSMVRRRKAAVTAA